MSGRKLGYTDDRADMEALVRLGGERPCHADRRPLRLARSRSRQATGAVVGPMNAPHRRTGSNGSARLTPRRLRRPSENRSYGSPKRHPWGCGARDPKSPFSVVPTISFLATLSRRWSLPLRRAASGFSFSDNSSGDFASVGFMFRATVGCDAAASPWLSAVAPLALAAGA